jgi:AsmA-like C-terminal region
VASLDAAWHAALFSKPGLRPHSNVNQVADKDQETRLLTFLTNLDADIAIGSVSYHTLMIGPGRVIAKGIGKQLEIKMEPTIMAGGRVNATTTLARQGTRMQLTWSGTGQGLNVESIMQAAQPGREAVLKGTGSFVSSGSRPLNEESFRTHASGTFDFTVVDGQVLHSSLFQFLAKYTHLSELEQMGFDGFQGNVRLEDGWIHGDSLAITGSLASLEGNASVSPDDMAEGRIFVKIGPSLAKKIKIPCMSALLKTPDEFTALPVAIRINGSIENPAFSPDSAAWNYTKGGFTSVADTMKNLVRGCREGRQEERAQ